MRMTRLSVRISEEDRNLIYFLSKKTGLPRSEIIRLALQDFYEKALKDELTPEVKRAILIRKIEILVRQVKRLRWLAHEKRRAMNWLRYAKSGLWKKAEADKFNILKDLDLEQFQKLEEEILRLIQEVESLEVRDRK